MAGLGPSSLVGRIYVVDHLTIQNTKYLSSGPHGFREEDKCMGVNDAPPPTGRGQFGPQGLDCQGLCRGPLNIATY